MKKSLLLLSTVFSFFTAFSQVPVCSSPTSYNRTAYKILRNLNKSQIPTSVLYEYAYPLAEVDYYNGDSNTDTSTYSHFVQSYYELYRSTFNKAGILSPEAFEKSAYDFHPNKDYHHPVGIIDYNFNTIDPNSVINNLLSVSNNQLFDVPFRLSSPYINKTARLAVPLQADADDNYKVGTHYFHFSSAFVLSNSGFSLNQVQSINIKINGVSVYNAVVSGLQNAVIPVPVVCNEDDKQDIQIILQIPSRSNIYNIAANCIPVPPTDPCRGQDVTTITGYPYDGGYGVNFRAKATATIYYADSNCFDKRIRRPIIFVDGFDPGNKQHAREIWDVYLNKEFAEGNTTKKLGDELLKNGYDIIIFDPIQSDSANFVFTGGTSLIENNGLVLAKFLEEFYATHQSTMQADYVVVGASMGGIIARFGLAWMETNSKPHHTRLFISFDSPQAGAQIPLGLQYMVDTFTQQGLLSRSNSIKSALHQSAAAKQMILHHSSTDSETPVAHEWRAKLLANLASVGNYPTLTRNISISDGGMAGITKNIIPNPNPYNVEAVVDKQLELGVGIKRRLTPNCTQNICYKLHAQVYAQTANSRAKVYEFSMNNLANVLLLANFGTPFQNFSKYAVSNNNTSIDIAPGSRLRKDPLGLIYKLDFDVFKLVNGLAGKLVIDKNILKFSNFVPTYSSLDYQFNTNDPFNNYKSYQFNTLNRCSGTTPFDTAYAQPQDLDHVDIDANVANVFRNEVYFPKPKSVCAGECQDYLTLSSPLSNGAVANYKAAKAITLLPNFAAPNGSVIKADIGCVSVSNYFKTKYLSYMPPIQSTTTSLCPFDWDTTLNLVTCGVGFTNFKVFVNEFMDISTYAEFSLNGSNWIPANIDNFGYELNLNANPGQPQTFYARPKNDPTNVITITLTHCN
jgi:hypothetical protein